VPVPTQGPRGHAAWGCGRDAREGRAREGRPGRAACGPCRARAENSKHFLAGDECSGGSPPPCAAAATERATAGHPHPRIAPGPPPRSRAAGNRQAASGAGRARRAGDAFFVDAFALFRVPVQRGLQAGGGCLFC
jgi:hypothetical protein